jgi:hypothetical protein
MGQTKKVVTVQVNCQGNCWSGGSTPTVVWLVIGFITMKQPFLGPPTHTTAIAFIISVSFFCLTKASNRSCCCLAQLFSELPGHQARQLCGCAWCVTVRMHVAQVATCKQLAEGSQAVRGEEGVGAATHFAEAGCGGHRRAGQRRVRPYQSQTNHPQDFSSGKALSLIVSRQSPAPLPTWHFLKAEIPQNLHELVADRLHEYQPKSKMESRQCQHCLKVYTITEI